MTFKEKRVYVAGSNGMVGRALIRGLEARNYSNMIARTHAELDLIDQNTVAEFFAVNRPEIVIVAAGKVGGILANAQFGAEFLFENLMIEANVIHTAYKNGVEKLIFLGSSCIYPRLAAQPIREEELLAGPLESTNEGYAIAKIAGVKLCENYHRQYGVNFFSAMPTNLYGPNDNFDLTSSHVVPALMRKFHDAKIEKLERVSVWGTGRPRREFMFVDDLADAVIFLLENANADSIFSDGVSHINIGCGKDIEIAQLAEMIKGITGFKGEIVYDSEKQDGTPRKLLDVSRLSNLGWTYETSLEDGLRRTYEWFTSVENPQNSY